MESLASEARAVFLSGRTRPMRWRLDNLRAAERMLAEHHDSLLRTVSDFCRKPLQEVAIGDLWVTQSELKKLIKNVSAWARPEQVGTPLPFIPASARIEKQPFGATLVIGPSNYPIMLTLAPLLGAIAAGNTVVLKPSEHCPEISQLIADLLASYLDPEAIKVVQGGAEVVKRLLSQRWDKIIFTGSERVGKIVAAAAAKHLTPLTLELGGKCPVLVDLNAEPLSSIAHKVVWGRLFNGGQSCIAPEYILVPREQADELAASLVKQIGYLLGDYPESSPDLGRLIHDASALRVEALLTGHGGKVLCGGNVVSKDRFVSPTVILEPRADSPIMCEELFAPVLCVIPVDNLDDAIQYVLAKPTPLALYVFTSDSRVERRILDAVPSGTASINDVMIHFGFPELPFAGLGPSGYGALHGKDYFDACSQRRAVISKSSGVLSQLLDLQVWLRAPPYSTRRMACLKIIMTNLLPISLPRHYAYKALVASGMLIAFIGFLCLR